MAMTIGENVLRVTERIAQAAERALRDARDVKLVAVTKTIPLPSIIEAVEAGITCVGENRVQEAATKFARGAPAVEKHFVGHLQRNKAKKALELFDMIESVDTVPLAREISCRCEQVGRSIDALVEVNTSGEGSKFGFDPEDAVQAIDEMAGLPGLRIVGLMTVGAFLPDPEDVRPCFRLLRETRNSVEERVIPGVSMEHLSMGMTDDFEVAIEEGATIVRIGRAIFGERA